MTTAEIARLRALCAVKGGTCPVVLNENGGPLCAAREALPAALDEIERLRASLLDLSDVVWMHADWLEHAGYDGSRDDADRLRVEVRKAERLGLDPDAGGAK